MGTTTTLHDSNPPTPHRDTSQWPSSPSLVCSAADWSSTFPLPSAPASSWPTGTGTASTSPAPTPATTSTRSSRTSGPPRTPSPHRRYLDGKGGMRTKERWPDEVVTRSFVGRAGVYYRRRVVLLRRNLGLFDILECDQILLLWLKK